MSQRVEKIKGIRSSLVGEGKGACKTPGLRKRSKGKGRGLAKGKGKGPLGVPIGDKLDMEDVELDEGRGKYNVTATYTYKDGKWRGSDQLPFREVVASSDSEAEKKADRIYRKLIKDKGLVPKSGKLLDVHISVARTEDG